MVFPTGQAYGLRSSLAIDSEVFQPQDHAIFCVRCVFFIERAIFLCIIHNMNSRELIKQLEGDGWTLRSVKGSHHVFVHPVKPGHISVPHPKKDMGIGIVRKLLKQAGL